MKLYLVRHGQTDWNIGKQLQGIADIPLNQTGIEQAQELQKHIKERGLHFDYCYASPLQRARKTAEIITDGQYEFIYDPLLVERGYGELEGKIEEFDRLKLDIFNLRINADEYGIEPIKSVLGRAKQFLDKIVTAHPKDSSILIVAHGGSLRALHFNIVGYDDDANLRTMHFENCEMREYEI